MFDSSFDQLIKQLEFSHWGASALVEPQSFAIYESWLSEGKHAQMHYLKEQAEIKKAPQIKYAFAKSALTFAAPYLPHPKGPSPFQYLKIAKYAQGADYHHWLIDKLNQIIAHLKKQFPKEEFLALTDSAPILERDLANKSGLGWFGKNTCLIHPKQGSFFLIGEILTSLEIKNQFAPVPDFCGTCTRCIDACPTQALDKNTKSLDANKCISFWNIESREVPPIELRPQIGDLLFGCDVCQQVCPWNQKVFKTEFALEAGAPPPSRDDILSELKWILTSSNRQIQKKIIGTPLMRAGPFGLKRNALIIAGNMKARELFEDIRKFREHEKLSELADWALNEVS